MEGAHRPEVRSKKQMLTENRYRELAERMGAIFTAGMGAESVRDIVAKLDLEKMQKELRGCAPPNPSSAAKAAKRLGRELPQERQSPGVDDPHRAAGDPARNAPDGATDGEALRRAISTISTAASSTATAVLKRLMEARRLM